jgi:D-3-phosphoglycerate dehydrogenase / 2-oxoglutarate reductase
VNKQVLIAAHISNDFQSYLQRNGYELVLLDNTIENKNDIVGIVTSTKLQLDKHTIDQFPALKWVARLGSGTEIIDLTYCEQQGIAVASSPAGISNAVAEHCIAHIISIQKNIHSSFIEINKQQWIREANRGVELENKTVGLIGYGNTGMALAHKLSVFGCNVLAYDKYKKDYSDSFAEETTLIQLQEQADIISFHVPYNKETHHYYNQAFIDKCKAHILINTSRGAVVHTKDLLRALKTKQLLGACLDVLEHEALLQDSAHAQWNIIQELLQFNVLITPHIAGYSHNAIEKMCSELKEKLGDQISS